MSERISREKANEMARKASGEEYVAFHDDNQATLDGWFTKSSLKEILRIWDMIDWDEEA